MTSQALIKWQSVRLPRFDRLLAAHPESPGSGTDPMVAEEWTGALIVRLASEFQGFCRDLHDETVASIVHAVTMCSPPFTTALINGLTFGRGLNRRSADPATVHADFTRLGLDLWAELAARRPDIAQAWRQALVQLHKVRNGVAHDDLSAIAAVQAEGWVLNLGSVRRWRNLVDEIAVAVETTVNQDLADRLAIIPQETEI